MRKLARSLGFIAVAALLIGCAQDWPSALDEGTDETVAPPSAPPSPVGTYRMTWLGSTSLTLAGQPPIVVSVSDGGVPTDVRLVADTLRLFANNAFNLATWYERADLTRFRVARTGSYARNAELLQLTFDDNGTEDASVQWNGLSFFIQWKRFGAETAMYNHLF